MEYHSSKQTLFRAFHKAGLGAWVKKPIEQDQFALATWVSAWPVTATVAVAIFDKTHTRQSARFTFCNSFSGGTLSFWIVTDWTVLLRRTRMSEPMDLTFLLNFYSLMLVPLSQHYTWKKKRLLFSQLCKFIQRTNVKRDFGDGNL